MNITIKEPTRWLLDSSDAENTIREIFFQHWQKLKENVTVRAQEINAWRERTISQVNQYADEQMQLLANDFQQQHNALHEQCEENLDTVRACLDSKNSELLESIEKACQQLIFQVAQLEQISGTMHGIRVTAVKEQRERNEKENSNISESGNTNVPTNSTNEQYNHTQNNHNEYSDVTVHVKSSSNNLPISLTLPAESTENIDRSINNSNGANVLTLDDDSEISKCPICHMIFPLHMSHNQRSQHVNEHCTD